MTDRSLRIMQLSTADVLGGAESVAANLCRTFQTQGHRVVLAVGRKRSDDPHVLHIRQHEVGHPWRRLWWRVHYGLQPFHGRMPGSRWLLRLAQRLAEPGALFDAFRGREDFRYPGTWRLLDLTSPRPHVIHCHNLHGRYFDLRALPWLCRQLPVFLTLHDAWLLTGHCAHPFDCERWKTGCGSCPDLTIYPGVRRDATAFNWRRKGHIYAGSRLHVATPSRWLMERVEQSMLWPGLAEARVIPNGVDLSIFQPAGKRAVRASLGWPQDAHVLLFAARGIRNNNWKDFGTLRTAVARLARRSPGRELLLIALGESGPAERAGDAQIQFVPYERDPRVVARYYQAADVYVHAARADTFPTSVVEALACGTPVVATAVGGIPEQVKALSSLTARACAHASTHGVDEATGAVVPKGDAEAMALEIKRLLEDEALRRRLGDNASADATVRFDLRTQAENYLNWYRELLDGPISQPQAQPAACSSTVEPLPSSSGAAPMKFPRSFSGRSRRVKTQW